MAWPCHRFIVRQNQGESWQDVYDHWHPGANTGLGPGRRGTSGLAKELRVIVVDMARTKSKWPNLGLEPLVELMGGMDAVVKQLGMERVIQEVGVKRAIKERGVKPVIDEVGLDSLLANLTPVQKRELRRRLGNQ